MTPTRSFYDRLAEDYAVWIRALVPRYDEMLECVCGQATGARPGVVVDLGCGAGELSAAILAGTEHARVVGVDVSRAMAARARSTLEPFGSRARVVEADLRTFELDARADVVVSSLVLHNLSPLERAALLDRVLAWLRPGGPFIWGDFVSFHDRGYGDSVAAARRRFALESGCPSGIVEENFRKERERDAPDTVADMLRTVEDVGFAAADVVWAHDAFAVVRASAPAL